MPPRTSKQERKYPKEPEVKHEVKKRFKVLINGANFLKQTYETWEDADLAGRKFVERSNSTYVIVGG